MGNRKFSELRAEIAADPIRAERLQLVTDEVNSTYDAYQANLKQLRRARGLTQAQLAKILNISQPEVSRIERQTDVYLSTLQSYVAAMNGQLQLVAVFGDNESSAVDVSEITPNSAADEPPMLSVSVRPNVPPKAAEVIDLPQALTLATLEQKPSSQSLKDVANYLRGHNMPNMASLFVACAAGYEAADGDRIGAARALGTAGATARQHRNFRMAELLWRQSLDYDPTNYRSRSSLGQLLHHQGRYDEAIENLETVASMDNYAALFLGWSLLMKGLNDGNSAAEMRGIDEIVTAMHRWAYEGNRAQRSGWLRQVKRLDDLGIRFNDTVDNLLAFASSNSNFGEVSRDDLTELVVAPLNPAPQSTLDRDAVTEDDEFDNDATSVEADENIPTGMFTKRDI